MPMLVFFFFFCFCFYICFEKKKTKQKRRDDISYIVFTLLSTSVFVISSYKQAVMFMLCQLKVVYIYIYILYIVVGNLMTKNKKINSKKYVAEKW
jgi:amino acid transporter